MFWFQLHAKIYFKKIPTPVYTFSNILTIFFVKQNNRKEKKNFPMKITLKIDRSNAI